jgi:hypothetical protein
VTALPALATLAFVKLAIDLSEAQSEALVARAKSLGVAPEDLARAAVADALSSPSDEFRARAEELLLRNAELYRRLA